MPRRRSAVDADLAALYAQVPELQCRGRCQASCGPIEMSARERQRLRQHGVVVPPRQEALRQHTDANDGGHARGPLGSGAGEPGQQSGYRCPALSRDGACTVHEVRPMVCRLWGAVASLACPHGCTPAGGALEDADGMDLLAASLQAGGAPNGFTDVQPGIGQALRNDPHLQQAVSSYLRHYGRRP